MESRLGRKARGLVEQLISLVVVGDCVCFCLTFLGPLQETGQPMLEDRRRSFAVAEEAGGAYKRKAGRLR